MEQLGFDLDIRCSHGELRLDAEGNVRCKECGRKWSRADWAHIEEWGMELDALPEYAREAGYSL